MKLFIIENGLVKPTRESLMIYPYGEIWNRDTTEKKDIASKEVAFIEFFCSYLETNPYAGYTNEDTRKEKIIAALFRDVPDWQPDNLILDGVAVFEDLRDNASPTMKLFKAALAAMEKVQTYLETVDLTKTTKTGQLVNKPGDVVATVGKLSGLMTSFGELKRKVQQEALESTKTRGNRRVNHFEKMPTK